MDRIKKCPGLLPLLKSLKEVRDPQPLYAALSRSLHPPPPDQGGCLDPEAALPAAAFLFKQCVWIVIHTLVILR